MKNLPAILASIVLLAMASCGGKTDTAKPCPPKQNDVALELYYKYAEDTNLTVAYMGDYFLNGNKIDALMLRADSDDDWNQLKSDFGMLPRLENLFDEADHLLKGLSGNKKVVSVGIGIDADFLEDLALDTITELGQMDEECLNKMTEMIAQKIQGIMLDSTLSDTIKPSKAILVFPDKQNAADLGLAFPDSTMRNAPDYGYKGYVSAADDHSRTLWLFFYDDQEECNNILTHIKEDILVGGLNNH